MVLAVDIGNSNICIGGLDGADHRTIAFTPRMVTRPRCTEDEYAAEMKFLLQRLPVDPTACEGGIVCSGGPRLTCVLAAACAVFSPMLKMALPSWSMSGRAPPNAPPRMNGICSGCPETNMIAPAHAMPAGM